MKQLLANTAMVLITVFGLVLMAVVRILEGVVWLAKPFVMLWEQVRDAIRRK